MNAPDAAKQRERIVHGAFVTEGTMVAFPTCFPGVTIPLPADESHITALDITDQGIVYAGASGRAAHLLVGMLRGPTGMVFDLGVVQGADHCAAICCGREKFYAAVNGPEGGRIVTREHERLPFQLLQEWFIFRKPYEYLGEVVAGERICHAVTDASRSTMVGVTEGHLFTVDMEAGRIEVVSELAGRGRLARGSAGGIFGRDEGDTLWRFDPQSGTLTRKATALPSGRWTARSLMWASDRATGRLYTADDDGRLFAFVEDEGFEGPLGRLPACPVGPMAVTNDGRLYGSAGEGISRFFCYRPATGVVADLGVAVSVIERRRYGYLFGDAVTGPDGEIILGEDDDLGHLWLYFPAIPKR